MRTQLAALVAAGTIVGGVACGPPSPPPPPITGVSSVRVVANATYTGHDTSGVIAYHCIASVRADVALTDAKGNEYGRVTHVEAVSDMALYGGDPCFPFLWSVKVWMECVPDCGGPQGLWTGADPGRVLMALKREPGRSQIVVHVDAHYNGTPAQGDTQWTSDLIRCGPNPVTGIRTCLFPK